MTPAERRLRGQKGGFTTALTHDMKEAAARARRGFDARFYREVDEEFGPLPEAERERLARLKRKLYMVDLSAKAAAAARERREAKGKRTPQR